jgi:hypothetical protein
MIRNSLKSLGIELILRYNLRNGKGKVAGYCECGNELSGYIKCRELLDKLRTG